MNTFTYTQTAPATTWTVNHPFNGYPVLDVITNYPGTDQKILPTSVTYINAGQIVIQFSIAVAGNVAMAGNYSYVKNTSPMTDRSDTPLGSETE